MMMSEAFIINIVSIVDVISFENSKTKSVHFPSIFIYLNHHTNYIDIQLEYLIHQSKFMPEYKLSIYRQFSLKIIEIFVFLFEIH